MRIDKTVYTGRAAGSGRIPEEYAIYDKLDELDILYERIDHDHADTMEDCLLVEEALGAKICKKLLTQK